MLGFKSLAAIVIAALPFAVAAPVHASSILVDHGSTTYDPDTKLEWLDITATLGLSYNDVIGNNGVSYIQDGWRYATDFEVDQLYRHAGLPLASNPNGSFFYFSDTHSPGYAELEHDAFTLGSQLGWTSQSGDDFSTGAFFDIHQTPRNQATLGFTTLSIIDYLLNGPDSSFIVDEALDSITKNDRIALAGSMLVRDEISQVPVPSAMLLLASGLVLLAGTRLRLKRHAPI
jgi:hypothetical protein